MRFIVELMCAFTLLALRCVHTFYSKRVKVVETILPDSTVRLLFTGKDYARGGGLGRGRGIGIPLGVGVVVGVGVEVAVAVGVKVTVAVAVGVGVGVALRQIPETVIV